MPNSIYDVQHEGMIVIHANKDRPIHEKVLILANEPQIKTFPYGYYAGQFYCEIKLSFSPLDNFPYEDKESRADREKTPRMTIPEICQWVDDHQPNLVLIRGGEALYKYDDEVKHLVACLNNADKTVVVETSGVIFPDVFEKLCEGDLDFWDTNENLMPDLLMIHPQIFDAVPEEERGGYRQHLKANVEMWKTMRAIGGPGIEWVFDIDGEKNIKEQVAQCFEVMKDWRMDNEIVIFSPMYDDMNYREICFAVGQFLLNLPKTSLSVQVNHSFI
jgi:hypothetical protein